MSVTCIETLLIFDFSDPEIYFEYNPSAIQSHIIDTSDSHIAENGSVNPKPLPPSPPPYEEALEMELVDSDHQITEYANINAVNT